MVTHYAKVMGIIFLLLGILGFIPSLCPDGMLFNLFMVNPFHNMVHILSGAAFLYVGFTENWDLSRRVALFFAAMYGLIMLLGFLNPGEIVLGMRVNMADNVLHLAIATSALVFGLPHRYAMMR